MIERQLEKIILGRLNTGKIIILLGARQVGKTTLLNKLFANEKEIEWMNGDEQTVKAFFSETSAIRLEHYFKGKKYLIIDEAQQINDIGLRLKLMTDHIKDLQIIATGSSAFELANKTNEPLTGRKWEYRMFPLSFREMADHHGMLNEKRLLPHRLVYGYYPEVVTHPGDEKAILK
ncbi:MAG: ATP-binding protein [Mangrovibacterium sp.]